MHQNIHCGKVRMGRDFRCSFLPVLEIHGQLMIPVSETGIRTSAWEGVLLTAELIFPFLGGVLVVVLIPVTIAWLPGYTT